MIADCSSPGCRSRGCASRFRAKPGIMNYFAWALRPGFALERPLDSRAFFGAFFAGVGVFFETDMPDLADAFLPAIEGLDFGPAFLGRPTSRGRSASSTVMPSDRMSSITRSRAYSDTFFFCRRLAALTAPAFSFFPTLKMMVPSLFMRLCPAWCRPGMSRLSIRNTFSELHWKVNHGGGLGLA
jgi:hypothetical protein